MCGILFTINTFFALTAFMNIVEFFAIVSTITFFAIAGEFAYSFYKKDAIHSLNNTISNTLNGLFMRYGLDNLSLVYLGILVSIFGGISLQSRSDHGLISFIVCFLIFDFSWYSYHRAHHYFDFLWMFHSVHHSDHKFNLSTSYRFSWIEKIFNTTVFIPPLLLGFDLYLIGICFVLSSLYQFFQHSTYYTFPSFLGNFLIVPQIHKIHHDHERMHHNANYGVVLCIWDKFFGTYVPKIKSFTPGIKGYKQENFIKVQTDPIVSYLQQLKKSTAKK